MPNPCAHPSAIAHRTRRVKVRLLFALLAVFLSRQAYAHQPVDGDIRATLGTFTYRTLTPARSPTCFGPGLLVEADLNKYGGVEITMLYLRNGFSVQDHGNTLTETVKRIYISTGYRHWFSPEWSAGLSFASSYSMGDYRTIENTFPLNEDWDSSARDTTEYGLDLSVQYEPWRFERFSAVVDGRLGYNLTAKAKEDAHHLGLFIGLKYFVQARTRSPGEDDAVNVIKKHRN